MANPTDDDRALARCYLSWPDAADRLAHTFAVIREEGQQASAAAIAAEVERAVLERLIAHCQAKVEEWRHTLPLQSFRMAEHGAFLQVQLAELNGGEKRDG